MNCIKRKRVTMIVTEQMDVAILNAIHYALASSSSVAVVQASKEPLLDYAEFLLLRMTPESFDQIKRCFTRLPLSHLQEKLADKMIETLPQMAVEQVG